MYDVKKKCMPTSSNNSNIAIAVRNVSKTYFIARADGKGQQQLDALQNINLEIKKGEVIGIVGPNGSGKSTLLKVLSEITAPTTGSVEIYGKVASILEVGTGFNPDLSGRENIYLNAALHGMKAKEVDAKFDDIVELFGFPDFLDTPVKQYSSGMYMRLAFAVVVHIDADIYLFDEVLSVGDDGFKNRALQIIRDLNRHNKTICLVTHNTTQILDFTNNLALFYKGTIMSYGKPHTVIKEYKRVLNIFSSNESSKPIELNSNELMALKNMCSLGDEQIFNLKYCKLYNQSSKQQLICGDDLFIEIAFEYNSILHFKILLIFKDQYETLLGSKLLDIEFEGSKQKLSITYKIPANTFYPSQFKVDLYAVNDTYDILEGYKNLFVFNLSEIDITVQSSLTGYYKLPIIAKIEKLD
jgi:ABC-type polysaccharide/polyol phosphate transport system ATPase subunit